MALITARQFQSSLKRLNDEELRTVAGECFAFALYHYHNHGQKTPFMQMQAAVAESKSFLANIVKKLTLGRREKVLSEHEAEMRADAAVALAFADVKTQRAIAKEQKAARIDAKANFAKEKADATPEKVTGDEIVHALVLNGNAYILDVSEAQALEILLWNMRLRATEKDITPIEGELLLAA